MNTPRIAVTGIGLVSPLGQDKHQAWRRLMDGEGGIEALGGEGHQPTIPAARLGDFQASRWLNKLQMVGTERVSQMALGAARLAMDDAGLGAAFGDPERAGLYLGTGMGGAATVDAGYAALHAGRHLPPLTVPTGMVNNAAAIVAMHAHVGGPVLTFSVACASSAIAIAEAAHALRRGEIDIALAGGSEALLVRGSIAAWQALHTLAPLHASDVRDSCRPFAADRDGLVLGEGACFLVLERAEDAQRRGRSPYARLAGSAVRCDARHLTRPHAEGQVSAMAAALRSAGLAAEEVGYCNAHGTATRAGDPVECEAMRKVWQGAAPELRVSSTKAAHGHLLGAAGALEAAWTVLALHHGEVPPTRGRHELDAACGGLRHVLGSGEAVPGLRHAMSNSFAFGGTNASLVFSRE